MKKCQTKYCRGTARKYRKKCPKCRSREYKRKHPMKYFYNVSRLNAKRRGHSFDLTFTEYVQLWKSENKRPGNGWHIDRIDPNKGYQSGNVQILSGYLNVMKWHENDKFMIDFKHIKVRESDESEAPF